MFNTFPHNLRFRTSGFHVVGASSEPQQSISGAYSVQPRLGAHWIGSVTFMVTNEETTLALQAFVAGMEGMLGTTAVPIYQRYGALDLLGRRPDASGSVLGNGEQHEGRGSVSAEHWGFGETPAVYGELASAASLRAAEITVAPTAYGSFRPGQDFSIGGRLHRAVNIWPDGVNDRVRITPPLRAAAGAGGMVVLDRPTCLMRFASEDEGQMDYQITPVSTVTMNFVEAI